MLRSGIAGSYGNSLLRRTGPLNLGFMEGLQGVCEPLELCVYSEVGDLQLLVDSQEWPAPHTGQGPHV